MGYSRWTILISVVLVRRRRIQLRVGWIIRRIVQTHKSQPSLVGSNQLTGNYREINRFCASLHESLDDVAKSQPLYVYIFPLVVAAFLEKLEIGREKADADANSPILLPEFSVYSYAVGQITGD